MKRFVLCLSALALALAGSPVMAQVPPDVTTPTLDTGDPARPNVPTRVPSVALPQIQLIFDSVLDPQRISLIESIGESSLNDARLTEGARTVILNHIIAMQQVELAIQFLQANQADILSGNNVQFNTVFGNPGIARDVAITESEPLSGLARVTGNTLTGQTTLDFQDQTMPNLPGQIQPGQFVFVGDAVNGDPDGFVAQVEEVLYDDDGSNQQLVVTPQITGTTILVVRNMRPVHRIIRFERQTDPARYDRVLMTFQAIRSALSGFDPDLPPFLQTASAITYSRDFTDINNFYLPGTAQFAPLDAIVQRELSRTGITATRGADRLVRQAGFSNSDSHLHLDRLEDQANGQLVDYQGRPTMPLLWTEDNELPLDLEINFPIAGATDEDRAFFRDQQTIFGAPDNPFDQYLGRAFFEETLFHAREFFDDTVAVDPGSLALAPRLERRPARGNLFDRNGDGLFNDFIRIEVPESGTSEDENTEFRRWQMIIESFAEHSTDLDQFNVAAVGVGRMFGDFVPDDLKARDAGNYARFAALIGGSGSTVSIDVQRIEPFGKRATAGFNPVVPRN